MSEQAAAQNLALTLAEKWDEAFEKAYWGETSSFIDVVLPVAEVMVRLAEAIGLQMLNGHYDGCLNGRRGGEPDDHSNPSGACCSNVCIRNRVALAAFDALVKEGE